MNAPRPGSGPYEFRAPQVRTYHDKADVLYMLTEAESEVRRLQDALREVIAVADEVLNQSSAGAADRLSAVCFRLAL